MTASHPSPVITAVPLTTAVDPNQQIWLPMVSIPSGTFMMGSPGDEPDRYSDEGPQHEVTLEAFQMSQTPITQAQWQAVMGNNPSHFQGEQRPVEEVSWYSAMEFCAKLSKITGENYTLPSEAQWEYACRAGTTTAFHFGATIASELANYDGSFSYANGPKGEYRKQTTPVGMFLPNAWGLHDMHGNVWEWCLDDWHESYEGAPTDGSAWVKGDSAKKSCAAAPGSTTPGTAAPLPAPTTGPAMPATTLASVWSASKSLKLLRGGSWFNAPRRCRSAYRSRARPVDANDFVGFRVVCLPQGPSLDPSSINPSTLAVNIFPFPHDAKVTECVFHCSSEPARMGGTTVSMILASKREITLPDLPFFFVWFTGAWLARATGKLPSQSNFCYHIEAQSMANLQDLAELLKLYINA